VRSELWFRWKWVPAAASQTHIARAVAAVGAHGDFACESTAAWKVENDAGSGEYLMSCQRCTSEAQTGSCLDESEAGRGSAVR